MLLFSKVCALERNPYTNPTVYHDLCLQIQPAAPFALSNHVILVTLTTTHTVNQSTTHGCVFECAVAAVIQISNPAVHQEDRVVHRAPGDEARQRQEGQVRSYLLDHVPHVFLVDTLASSLGQLTITRRLRDHELCKLLC